MRTHIKLLLAFLCTAATLHATPSTQIWNPSTDVQSFGVVHLGFDSYWRTANTPIATNTYDAGVTVGILPFKKIQAEVGVDYITTAPHSLANAYPMYFNVKIGTPEDAWFKNSPALAFGGYNYGAKKDITTQNINYVLASKTIPAFGKVPSLGRFSAGYYQGSSKVLVDENGNDASDGFILTWDRAMPEISNKLWLCADYTSGHSANGQLSIGFSWAFTKKLSAILAEDFYNNQRAGGKPTITLQLDYDINK